MDAAAAFVGWEGTERADAVDAPPLWNAGDSSRPSAYGELAYELLSPGPINLPGVSSWDVASRSGVDIRAGAKGRAPPDSVEEPLYKKTRSVPGGVFYSDEAGVGGYGHAGYEEGILGSGNGRSGSGTGVPGGHGIIKGGSDAAVDYGYGVSGGESFGAGFGMQQVVPYGSGTSGHSPLDGGIPSRASERFAQGSAPGVQQQLPDRSSYGNGAAAGFATGRGKGSGTMLYKTRLCINFKTGTCTYNENCHFAHGIEELRKPPREREAMLAGIGGTPRARGGFSASDHAGEKLKIRVCKYFAAGNCPFGDRCNFLHDQDTQITPGIESFHSANIEGGRGRGKGSVASKPSYKTRICSRWENGETCKFGENCHFAHGFEELQQYGGGTVLNLKNDTAVPTFYHGQSEMQSGPSLVMQGDATNKQIDDNLVPASTLNLYQSSGASTKLYFNSLEDDRSASGYGYWDKEKKWEDGNATDREPDIYSLEYEQGNQTQSWMPPYADTGTFARRNDETGSKQYSGQPLQGNQLVSFSRGGGIVDYPGFKQDLISSYGQDDCQNKYQEANRNGEVEFLHGGHSELSYSTHLGKYSSSY